jgi:hypothetical protein
VKGSVGGLGRRYEDAREIHSEYAAMKKRTIHRLNRLSAVISCKVNGLC